MGWKRRVMWAGVILAPIIYILALSSRHHPAPPSLVSSFMALCAVLTAADDWIQEQRGSSAVCFALGCAEITLILTTRWLAFRIPG